MLVAIAGGSGAGKTTRADMVAEEVGEEKVVRITTDRFYRDFKDPELANYDHPNSIDWEMTEKILSELIENEEPEIPKYNFSTHSRESFETFKSSEVIVLEGIFSLVGDKICEMADLKIYVETDPDIRFIWRLTRDTEERGRNVQSVIDQWLSQMKPMQEEFIRSSRKNAHVIVPEDPDRKFRETAGELLASRLKANAS